MENHIKTLCFLKTYRIRVFKTELTKIPIIQEILYLKNTELITRTTNTLGYFT